VFHGTSTFLGELLDEIPMSILAMGYIESLRGVHPLTRSPGFFLAAHSAVLTGWVVYAWTLDFRLFAGLFTAQVFVAGMISALAGPEPALRAVSRRYFYAFVVAIGLAKAAWEFERYLHSNGKCPTDITDVLYWLHPFWHFGSASAHSLWMHYVLQLQVARCDMEGRAAARQTVKTD
jgi:hypothetical protein